MKIIWGRRLYHPSLSLNPIFRQLESLIHHSFSPQSSSVELWARLSMRLFIIFLLCGAIVNAASSFIFTDDSWSGIVTGVPFQLTWVGNSGPVTITLNNGTTADPHLVNTIASKIPVLVPFAE
jgi:hypothetical protein